MQEPYDARRATPDEMLHDMAYVITYEGKAIMNFHLLERASLIASILNQEYAVWGKQIAELKAEIARLEALLASQN